MVRTYFPLNKPLTYKIASWTGRSVTGRRCITTRNNHYPYCKFNPFSLKYACLLNDVKSTWSLLISAIFLKVGRVKIIWWIVATVRWHQVRANKSLFSNFCLFLFFQVLSSAACEKIKQKCYWTMHQVCLNVRPVLDELDSRMTFHVHNTLKTNQYM